MSGCDDVQAAETARSKVAAFCTRRRWSRPQIGIWPTSIKGSNDWHRSINGKSCEDSKTSDGHRSGLILVS